MKEIKLLDMNIMFSIDTVMLDMYYIYVLKA